MPLPASVLVALCDHLLCLLQQLLQALLVQVGVGDPAEQYTGGGIGFDVLPGTFTDPVGLDYSIWLGAAFRVGIIAEWPSPSSTWPCAACSAV
jgi:hypothetical protein